MEDQEDRNKEFETQRMKEVELLYQEKDAI